MLSLPLAIVKLLLIGLLLAASAWRWRSGPRQEGLFLAPLLLNLAAANWCAASLVVSARGMGSWAVAGWLSVAISLMLAATFIAAWHFSCATPYPPRWLSALLLLQPVPLVVLGALGIGVDEGAPNLRQGFWLGYEIGFGVAVAMGSLALMGRRWGDVSRFVRGKVLGFQAVMAITLVTELLDLNIACIFAGGAALSETWLVLRRPSWLGPSQAYRQLVQNESAYVFAFDARGLLTGWNDSAAGLQASVGRPPLAVGLTDIELLGAPVASLAGGDVVFGAGAAQVRTRGGVVPREEGDSRGTVLVLRDIDLPRMELSHLPGQVGPLFGRDAGSGLLSRSALWARVEALHAERERVAVLRIDLLPLVGSIVHGAVVGRCAADLVALRPGLRVGRFADSTIAAIAPDVNEIRQLTVQARGLVDKWERESLVECVITPIVSERAESIEDFHSRLVAASVAVERPRRPRWY